MTNFAYSWMYLKLLSEPVNVMWHEMATYGDGGFERQKNKA
jgi:hypothetical protein